MNKRGRLIAFSCVGMALLAVVAWRVGPRRESEVEAAPDAARLRCVLEAGQTRAFRIVVTPSDAEGERPPLTAELHLRTLEGPSGPTQAAQVAALVVPTQDFPGADQVSEPFLISVDNKCRFERFAFNAATSPGQAAMLEGTLRLFEVVGGDTRAAAWEVLQHDANGEFFARYERGAFDEHTLDFQRRSSDYREAHARGASIQQLRFDSAGRFDADWAWVTSVAGRTQHRVMMRQDPTDVSMRFELERTNASAPLGLPGSMDVALFRWDSDRGQETLQAPEEIGGMTRETIAALDSAGMTARALELWNGDENQAHEEVYQFLLAWVREHRGARGGSWAPSARASWTRC